MVALVVAVLALVLAGGSALFAWRAIDQAKDAKAIALAGPGRVSSASPPTDPGAPPVATDAPATSGVPAGDPPPRSPDEVPELTEQTLYQPKYQKQSLVLKATCSSSMYADLDEPRARNESAGTELRFIAGCGNEPTAFRLMDGVEGSEAGRPGMTPQECATQIRLALIAQNARIPARKGSVLCVTTNYRAAKAAGDDWRMVLVEVVGVANDGATTIEVSAWNIPD
ncbi:hypothetical protein C1A38_09435 [Verrucosispora sp. ts21]|nr:hypothetical protein C1A38_09435 [Verrucosispora sp. ts21]